MTGAELLRDGIARLRDAGIEGAAGDARRLLAHAIGVASDRLTLVLPEDVDEGRARAFRDAIARRSGRVPVSRIVGGRSFYGRMFRVTPDVLDPRPETESLIERALAGPFHRVIDLGTGTGCILATLLAERPDAQGVGTDISPDALTIARENAHALGVSDRAQWRLADWWTGIDGAFDLIVSNPPYIAATEMQALAPEVLDHDPRIALSPGGDGLGGYRKIAEGAAARAAPGARILVEIGPTQARDVSEILSGAGCARVEMFPDLDGRDRVIEGAFP